MKLKTSFLVAGLALAGLAGAQTAPKLPSPAYPVFKSVESVNIACDEGLNAANARLKRMEARKPDAGWIKAFDAFYAANEDDGSPIDFLQYVAVKGEIRDAAQACSLRWAEYNSALSQNPRIYAALKALRPEDAMDKELVRVQLEQFETAGAALPPAKRERAKAIIDKLTALDQQFNKNIRDAGVKVRFTEAELEGVPKAVWEKAPREADGRVVLGIANPTYFPVMQLATSAAARERMWFAKTNEGGQANLAVLAELTHLRKELAGLFGYDNYVDYKLHDKMAHDANTAWKFLDDVKDTVIASDRADMEVLRQAKAKALGQDPAKTEFKAWDASFYAEQVRRERYAVNQEAFREYFPSEQALAFVMRVVEKMMGVRYTKVDVDLWAPGVSAYVVSDAATGKPISQLYVDLYPREGKYNHAAVWGLRSGSTVQGRAPVAALVVNFNDKGLTLDEMMTLLHEFGHSVHNNLSSTRRAIQGGTSVVHDFVEAPSQMLEDWVYDGKVLAVMGEVCPSCKPVPADLLAKATAARDFGKGSGYARQRLYAAYDLALHGKDEPAPLALWARMEGETPIGYVPGSLFPAHFAHIAGDSYSAGYYGYLWSLVIAMDLRTAFKADKLDPKVGMAYRNKVLAQGSQHPADELVKDFLGRPWNSKAFFEDLKR